MVKNKANWTEAISKAMDSLSIGGYSKKMIKRVLRRAGVRVYAKDR